MKKVDKYIKYTLPMICVLMFTTFVVLGFIKKPKSVTTGEIGVVKDEEFNNIYLELSINEFIDKGFTFGDSIDVAFDNGETIKDIPFLSGYYVPIGALLACGYPGYPHVVIARNFGASTWEEYHMTDYSRVTVTLNEKGKYIDTEDLFSLKYSDDRKDFDSDIEFANFREVIGGKLERGKFYRSASPIDNQHKRAAYANQLAKEKKIKFFINLSDNETKYEEHVKAKDFDSAYYDSIYKKGNVLLLGMNANYRSDDFAKIISRALLEMTNHDGPVLVHCVEGKDRTGFVCALMLALSDAMADEIIDDYMITHANYYGVTKEEDPDKYEAILGFVNDFFYCMCDADKDKDVHSLDLKKGAENYLKKGGLTTKQIAKIEAYLK